MHRLPNRLPASPTVWTTPDPEDPTSLSALPTPSTPALSSDRAAPWRNPRYTFIRTLGHGGFGDVHLAHDAVRGHAVALKMLRGMGDESNAQLRREFRILKDVDHPGIVELLELHLDEHECLFTMEFVRGATITDTLAQVPRAERDARAWSLVAALVEAVAALHASGVLHRDLKPSNILVTPEGRLVVVDAGLARFVDASSRESFGGTLAYMAPEQARGLATSTASDWYAVGAIAFELLSGALPFEGDPRLVVHQKSVTCAPSLATVCSASAAQVALVDRMLAPSPVDRPEGAELLRSLPLIDPGPGHHEEPRIDRRVGHDIFVGRTDEVARLDAAFADVASRCTYVALSGPSGIGKTSLVNEWLMRLGPRKDTIVFTGRCHQRETVPLNGIGGVLDALERSLRAPRGGTTLPEEVIAAIARVPGWTALVRHFGSELAHAVPPDPVERQRASARAVTRVLQHVVGKRRLVLWVDDAQWGPLETAFFLAELSRSSWPAGAFVVLSHRPLSVGDAPCVKVLGDVVSFEARIELGPLRPDEARALIEAHAPRAQDEAAERLVGDGAGHPLLLTQAAPLLMSSQPTETHIEAVLRARVDALSEGARQLLQALCVARTPISERAATLASASPTVEGEARRLIALGLVRRAGVTGHLLTPFHDQLRAVVIGDLSVEARAAWNLRVAAALEPEVEPETLIDYLMEAGERRRAYELVFEAAARMDRALAFERAAELYRMAVELATEFAADRIHAARIALAEALVNCGRCHEAAQVYLAAAKDAPTDVADALSGSAALELLRGGYIAEGLELAHRTFKRLGIKLARTSLRALPSIVWDRLRLWRRGYRYELRADDQLGRDMLTRIDWCLCVGTVLPLVDTLRGFQVHNQGLRWALDAGEPSRLARVLAVEVGYRNVLNSGSEVEARAAALLRSAETLAAGTGDAMAKAVVEIMRASARWSVGDWPGCVAAATEGARTLREHCRGASWEVNFAMTHMLDAMVWMADFEDHERTFRAELEDANARGDRYAQLMYVVRDLMMNATVRDTLDVAEARADGIMAPFGNRGFQVENLAELFERNHFALYRGQGEVGYRLYRSAWSGIKASQLMRLKPFRIEVRSGLGRAAAHLASELPRGRARDKLVREASRLGQQLDAEHPGPRSLVLSCPVVAAAAHLGGDDALARTRLERGIADAARSHMRAHEQAFRCVLARLDHDHAEARRALDALAARGVRRPERYTNVLVPGFGDVM